MATIIGSFVGKYLLNKLASFTEENIVMITGVKDDLREMEGRMRHIETFLTDAENRRITDKLVHNWLNELKDVMYDADDMIDLWRYKNQQITTEELSSSSNPPTCSLFPLLSCFHSFPARRELAVQVRSLNTRLERIFNDMSILNLHHIKSETHGVTRLDPGVSSPIIRTDEAQCRIHELFRSLGQYLSRAESYSADQLLPGSVAFSQLRRVSIEKTNENNCISVQTKPLALRTFMIFNCLSRIENSMFVRFKKLRVLRINGKGFNSIPETIGDLIHLRLLDLEGTGISSIPECIASLTNLLFLNLAHCARLEKLPKAIIKLCNLRHLIIDGTPLTSVPKGLGKLQKLTEIFGFQVIGDGGRGEDSNGWDLRELEGLSQLKRIWISKLERARDVSDVLASKTHLKQSFLFFSEVYGNSGLQEELENENSKGILEKLYPPPCIEELRIINYRSRKLPGWMSSSSLGELLSNLLYLHLFGWSICTDLPPLGLLPNLKQLGLLPVAGFEGEISPSWQLMPHLKQLGILQCPKLRGLPEGLQHLTAVKELIVREAHSMRSIQDFQFECEFLEIKNNQCLEIVANLPKLKKLAVSCNPNLRHVSQLVSLTKLILVDYNTDCLPEWAIRFMETNGRVVFQ